MRLPLLKYLMPLLSSHILRSILFGKIQGIFLPFCLCEFLYTTDQQGIILKLHTFLCSSFMDIFDVDHFINVLKDDISIVKELPDEFSWSTREYYAIAIRATRIKMAPVHASANWYLENVSPVLQRLVHLYLFLQVYT